MDPFAEIYSTRAAEYHRMIAAEDVDGNLLKELELAAPFKNRRVLDLGTGTGRIPLLIANRTRELVALDIHLPMLGVNQQNRSRVNGRWSLVQADMRELPLPEARAEIVIAGWAIGHLRGWFADTWQSEIGRVLREMERVATPGATLVIFETMTTGSLAPAPPNEHLAEYYAWLEAEHEFTRHVFRTDYQFVNLTEAVELTEFFFGPELADKIRENNWVRLPEWTGMWVKHLMHA